MKYLSTDEMACAFFGEAHRMFENRPGMGMKKGENLIKRCIQSSKVSVFFLDEDQAVTVHDYLTEDVLKIIAKECKSKIVEGPKLTTQFRVLGGEKYLNFIRSLLGYENAEPPFDFNNYDFKVFDTAYEMRDALREMNRQYGDSRMVAGYTYEWDSESDPNCEYDIELDDGKFRAKWNMRKEDYSWLYDNNSFEDVGCIHTCQGLDMQYCGVIMGNDIRYENGKVIFDKTKIAKSDYSSGIRTCSDDQKAARLIRNTYNVLLTRGMRGTFIYCEDEKLREHIKSLIDNK